MTTPRDDGDRVLTPDELAETFNGTWLEGEELESELRQSWPAGDVDRWLVEAKQVRAVAATIPKRDNWSHIEQPRPLNEQELEIVKEVAGVFGGLIMAQLLDKTKAYLLRFVWFSSDFQADAVTLWIAHTWWKASLETTPYLAIWSPEKGSGKSRLLDACEQVSCDPWRIVFPTAAVVYRKIEQDMPTMLIDEIDAIFGKQPKEDLRGVFNDGHRRGGRVARMGGKNNTEIQEFSTFCPKAFAGIGRRSLPDTILDRSIVIHLKKKKPSDKVEEFRQRNAELDALPLRDWWEDISNRKLLALDADPEMPQELSDRAKDGWEPLLAIADLAGGRWPKAGRAAAVALAAEANADDDSRGVRLLRDIQRIWPPNVESLRTADLLEKLHDLEDAPWAEIGAGKGLTAHYLSKLLRPFDVHPKKIRFGSSTAQGYTREAFDDPFGRYLANQTGTSEHA